MCERLFDTRFDNILPEGLDIRLIQNVATATYLTNLELITLRTPTFLFFIGYHHHTGSVGRRHYCANERGRLPG